MPAGSEEAPSEPGPILVISDDPRVNLADFSRLEAIDFGSSPGDILGDTSRARTQPTKRIEAYSAARISQPNVKQYASTPASRNSISNKRSMIGPGWRISW